MKCIVTGHTSGIGKEIYNHFQSKGWDVIGLSRSNGYNIVTNQDEIVNLSIGCDLFVNCAYDGSAQLDLLNKLHNKVKKMIVIGSVGADYSETWQVYGKDKFALQEQCKELSRNSDSNIFYLKLAFCENSNWPIHVDDNYKATFKEILKTIDFWLEVPKIYSIEFTLKTTTAMLKHIGN